MSLLDKFSAVEVKNVNRLNEEDLEYVNKKSSEYKRILEYNNKLHSALKTVLDSNIDEYKEISFHTKPYHTYVHNSNDSLGLIRKDISNLHYHYIGDIVGYFTKKYNITCDAENFEIIPNYKRSDLYNHKAYPEYSYHGSEKRFENIENVVVDYNDIIDYLFKHTDMVSFDQHKKESSVALLKDMYRADSHRADIKVAKNGSVQMPTFMSCPEYRKFESENTNKVTSLSVVLEQVYYECGSMFNDKLSPSAFKDTFCVGKPYSPNISEQHSKHVVGDDIVEYYHLNQSGALKIKFRNAQISSKFINKIK
ncbi:hypothetical protein HYO65_gp100 [Tenacibaculum phage PTm1]|uniref:Uncharacterized protein n=2 Tax=Shirahamavirus PTm1 TaxID=2846435 RepID=A0A5S9HY28_9CAUD|nr:hypothetical protein HYO65_gp100 [Tenacibaculum phage PTm1]BBI90492.1 hypothetical protein [Tenacibaculum phage PTm1]BBI90800.1 hypothetical protein [Tenacibaculum phage PTm5]